MSGRQRHNLYVGAKTPRVPHLEESFGYSFEMPVLYAQSMGIGTVWIGGTMDRSAFERAIDLQEHEIMPYIKPLTKERAGRLAEPLETVRWAPSAVNKQPWRVMVKENSVHFYLKHTKCRRSTWVSPSVISLLRQKKVPSMFVLA